MRLGRGLLLPCAVPGISLAPILVPSPAVSTRLCTALYHSHVELFLRSVLQIQNKSSREGGNELSNDFKDHTERCSAMKGGNFRKPVGTTCTTMLFVSLEQNQL